MSTEAPSYEPRYLAGILFFNRRDFFEAHEVWEDLWHVSFPPERRFIQSLIQAAVALFHFGNGNVRGAGRLYQSSKDYAQPYLPTYLGMDVAGFWRRMDECFAGMAPGTTVEKVELNDALMPSIQLDPPPMAWPVPEDLLPDEDE